METTFSISRVINTSPCQIDRQKPVKNRTANDVKICLIAIENLKKKNLTTAEKNALLEFNKNSKQQEQKSELLKNFCKKIQRQCEEILNEFPEEIKGEVILPQVEELAKKYSPFSSTESPVSAVYVAVHQHAKQPGKKPRPDSPATPLKIIKKIDTDSQNNHTITFMNGEKSNVSFDFKFTGAARHNYGKNVYDGEWVNDQTHGFGQSLFIEEKEGRTSKQKGLFSKSALHGYGKTTTKVQFANFDLTTKATYAGQYKKLKRHGIGRNEVNGDIYKGQFKNDEMHGFGIMSYANGDTYKGKWVNGQRHGEGTMTYANNSKYLEYKGSWKNGVFEGQGVINFKGGNVYTGKLKNGVAEGEGKLQHPDGTSLEGNFKDNLMHGKGKKVFCLEKQQCIIDGDWHYGSCIDEATITLPNKKAVKTLFNSLESYSYFMKYTTLEELEKMSSQP